MNSNKIYLNPTILLSYGWFGFVFLRVCNFKITTLKYTKLKK